MIYIVASAVKRNDGVIVTDRCHASGIHKSPFGTCNTADAIQGFITSCILWGTGLWCCSEEEHSYVEIA